MSPANQTHQLQTDGLDGTIPLEDADTKLLGEAANDTAGWSVAAVGDVNGDGSDDVLVGAPRNGTDDTPNSGAAYLFYGPVERVDIDLSSADVTFRGESAGDRAGWSVSGAGDLNEDGYVDMLVGAPLDDDAGRNAGAVYVIYGGESLTGDRSLADADAKLLGEAAGDRAGWAVANVSAADDGATSILVGAPNSDWRTPGENAGAVYLLEGDSVVDGMSLGQGTVTLTGEAAGDRAGWSVDDAGDVNGDGATDIVVGARGHNVSDAPGSGAVYIVSARISGDMNLADADVKVTGEAAGDNLGFAVSGAGDLNDDGYGDVVVGAPLNDGAERNAGAAYVIYGDESLSGTLPAADAGLILHGESAGDRAGWSVAGVDDVTCDEIADVLLGAPRNDAGGNDAGAAYVISGRSASGAEASLADADATLLGEADGDNAGWAVSDGGDADGDGTTDIIVGAPRNDGAEGTSASSQNSGSSGDANGTDAGAAYVVRGDCPVEEPEKPAEPKDDDRAEKRDQDDDRKPSPDEDTTTKTTKTTTTETTTKTTTETTTKTTIEPEPKGSIEFINCTAVRVTGDFDEVYLDTYFYMGGGFGTEFVIVGSVDGTRVIDLSHGRGQGINGRSGIATVIAYEDGIGQGEPTLRKESPLTDDCDLRPRKPNVSVVDKERTDDGRYEVTFEYTNPNDGEIALGASSRFVEGTTDDEPPVNLKAGTHQFTVTWTPQSEDERLVWAFNLDVLGYEEEVRAIARQQDNGTPTETETTTEPAPVPTETPTPTETETPTETLTPTEETTTETETPTPTGGTPTPEDEDADSERETEPGAPEVDTPEEDTSEAPDETESEA